jgi:hydrogenase maturation protease
LSAERLAAPGDALSAERQRSLDGVLVVGYGNTLRRDDGIGQAVAERLSARLRRCGATVLALHQLLPELADEVARASFVVFVDARPGVRAGSVACAPLGSGGALCSSHGLDPPSLLALARLLHGAAPPALLVTVGTGSTEHGAGLTPAVRRSVPLAAEAVVSGIEQWLHGRA